jgi:hypothetical protein
MLKNHTNNRNNFSQNWATQIKMILDSHGFSYIWHCQFDIDIPFEEIKLRVIDTYKQNWYCEINNSSRLHFYSIYKHDFMLEKYFSDVCEQKFRIALTKYRISAHKLRIKTGRYDDTPRQSRLCTCCNSNQIEEEYHFLLVCPYYRDIRIKYLPSYYCHWPKITKFESILSSNSRKRTQNLSRYLYFAFKRRGN